MFFHRYSLYSLAGVSIVSLQWGDFSSKEIRGSGWGVQISLCTSMCFQLPDAPQRPVRCRRYLCLFQRRWISTGHYKRVSVAVYMLPLSPLPTPLPGYRLYSMRYLRSACIHCLFVSGILDSGSNRSDVEHVSLISLIPIGPHNLSQVFRHPTFEEAH